MKEITTKDMCELMSHIDRKAKEILERHPTATAVDVYEDLARQVKREAGAYRFETADAKYLYAMHEAIDCYGVPAWMLEGEKDD